MQQHQQCPDSGPDPGPGPSRGSGGRERAERMLQLARHLPRAERALISAIYERGMTAAQLARLANVHPQTIRRRVHRICRRMNAPLFQHVVAHQHTWPRTRRRIARLRFVHGMSQRATATALHITVHRVRLEEQAVLNTMQSHELLRRACAHVPQNEQHRLLELAR